MTEEFKQGFISGLAALGITFNTSNNNSSEGTTDYNKLKNIPISLDENGNVVISKAYQSFFDSLAENTTDYNELSNIPLSLNENGDIVISSNYQSFFDNLAKDTNNYNEILNIPISLDENGKVIINEQYKTFFDSLANENIKIPTVITNYDQLENTPTIKLYYTIEPTPGVPGSEAVEGYTIKISPEYKDFFKNLIKEALIELPIASNEILGGVKIGKGLTISEDGTLSVEYTPSTPSNDGVKVASIAEILEDKNILINNTISSDYAYLPADGQATNNTLIGGLYVNG